uniref:Uncharacterized protein n=1 Tax=Mycena chlorophos TaxID=658473 RepID=A0ABQ0MAM3_MYCCL|nr:predicted protein [Mycena chlorophos]
MTAPADSLQPPEGGYHQPTANRPASPLRNGFLPNSTTTGINPEMHGDDDDDIEHWRSPSPASSVSHVSAMAASFVRSMMDAVSPPRPGSALPLDEEEAEMQREMSRREAERILRRETEDRRQLEDRVLAMMESTKSLPPPPSRTQSMDPPSPSSSQKEGGGWWAAAKNRLTPSKDSKDLTPAQQVIQDTKAKEKESKKNKGKDKEKEWPAKYSNPSYTSLVPPSYRSAPSPSSPSTPPPSRPQNSNLPPNLTPSPMRHDSPRQTEAPPLYAHFDETTGTLDVHVTLLTIAKRFEKLEKWTVGHVRALEERMGDVERWLVDKENEREAAGKTQKSKEEDGEGMVEIREGLHELQSRVSSLGREIAKLATAPANLSQTPQARYPAEISAGPNTPSSSFAVPGSSPRAVSGHTARDSTSPPMRSNSITSARLPYPTGDYASPPGSVITSRDVFSSSPVSGLPGTASTYSSASFPTTSPISSKPSELPVPKAPSRSGRGSVSPTPKKRYTVALGGSVESDNESGPDIGTATFSGSDAEDWGGETIGKSAAAKLAHKSPTPLKEPRVRAQSAYGLSSIMQSSPTTVASLTDRRPSPIPHGRSKSIDRFGTGNFVDPLVLRKQTSNVGKDGAAKPLGSGKPVAQMVAFFDGDRK